MKHIEVVAAIIVKGKQILCLQRGEHKYSYLSQKFEFPGGKIEPGETREDALIREILEELEAEIEITSEYMTVEHDYPDFSITLHTFICRALQEDFTLTEHISQKWLEKRDLNSLDWAPADLPIIEKLAVCRTGEIIQGKCPV